MATHHKNHGHGIGKLIATLFVVMVMLTLAFMPAKVISAAWDSERSMTRAIGSATFDRWIMLESEKVTAGWGEAANAAIDNMAGAGLARALSERIYVAFVWLNLIVYRAISVMLWLLIGIPFVFAAAIDGYYVREIRKESFIAQSPIRHKLGARVMQHSTLGIMIWILLPVTVPPIISPLLILLSGFASWIWLANLQKRI